VALGSLAELVAELVRFRYMRLERICWTGGSFDSEGRRLLQALRRAVLRESLLARLLSEN